MKIEFASEVTEQQRCLAEQVEAALAEETSRFTRELTPDAGNGPAFEFAIPTTIKNPRVVWITVYQDSAHINAGAAEARIESGTSADDFEKWAIVVVQAVRDLLANPLRLRIRRTLFGSRTGAVYLGEEGSGGWAGDLFAALGLGREEKHHGWHAHV